MDNIKQEKLKVLRSGALNQINQGCRRQHSFDTDYTDINPAFKGRFTVHHPTQMERLRMGVLKASLLGNQMVDVQTENLAIVISTLDTVLDEKPDWFDMDTEDLSYDIMEAVYMEYLDWVNSFRGNNNKPTTGQDSETARSEVPVVDTENLPGTPNGQ